MTAFNFWMLVVSMALCVQVRINFRTSRRIAAIEAEWK